MKRKITALLIVVALVFSAGFSSAYAGHEKGGKCSCKAWGKQDSFEGMIYMKAHFLKQNQDEIGLSDEQLKQVMDLKRKTKKAVIAKDAEIDTLAVDVMANLYEKKIDVEGTKALIEQKYAAKKAKSLELVQALADLKSILTDEQYETMKKLWKEQEKKCKR